MSGKNTSLEGTEKLKTQRTTRRQTNFDANAKEGDAGEANEDELRPCTQGDLLELSNSLTEKIAAVIDKKMTLFSNKLDTITAKIESEARRLDLAEQRISNTEDSMVELEAKIASAEEKLASITDRLDDQEARSRRDNIKILNLKEGMEGRNALTFFETWIPRLLNLETPNGRITLDRCHRLGRPRPGAPRPVIMKLHYPVDKVKILSAVAGRKLEFEKNIIFIRQDFPQNVSQQRRAFSEVCRKLIAKNIRFRMRFPAILEFTHDKKEYSFDTAAAASVIVDALDQELSE